MGLVRCSIINESLIQPLTWAMVGAMTANNGCPFVIMRIIIM